ncbi:tollo [Carabus blaptoides fortunei]
MFSITLILSLQILLTSQQLYDEDITFPIPLVILNHSSINAPALKFLGIINNCTCREEPEEYVVCFGNNCHEFPVSIIVDTPLFKLKLSMISAIKKHDLIFLHNVIYLEIESNINLIRLEPGCFQNMTKLRNLTISFNKNLKYLEEDTFEGLINLGTIIIQKNGFTNVLDITHALSKKYVPRIFLLDISENVFHNILVDAFFPMNGTNLQQLNMILCEIEYIHPDSLNPLRNLSSLRLGQNLFNTSVISQLIENTVKMGIPLDNLNLYDIGLRKQLPQNLLQSVGRSNITYLHLTKDNLEQIDDDSFPYMPNLRLLSLRDNLIFNISPHAFSGLKNLECMYIGMNRLSRVPKGLMLKTLLELDIAGNTYDGYWPTMFVIPDGIFANMCNLQNLHLEYNNIGFLTTKTFIGLRNLTKLNLKNISLYSIDIGTFIPLQNLLYLNLNNNPFLTNINADIFLGLTNLEILLLGGCSIKNLTIQPSIFSHLSNLKHIGLERNNLHIISPNQLTFLVRLESLSIADNSLSPWNKNVLPHGNLKILLANQNKFTYVTNKMLEDWKKLEILNLDGNPISCDCTLYPVVLWLKNNKMSVNYSAKNYIAFCVSPESWCRRTIVEYIQVLDNDNSECEADILFTGKCPYYKYDAFISYCNEDRDFVRNLVVMMENYDPYLKLCVYERDFQIGSVISEAVVQSVAVSRRTLLVISDAFAKSQWCRWETQLAEYHQIFFQKDSMNGPDDTLIMIRLGEISKSNMTPVLKYLMKTRIYLQWDTDQNRQKLFWEKLRATLTSSDEEDFKF